MLRLLPNAVAPTPPPRQTHAEASDAPQANMTITMANVARLVLIIADLPRAQECRPQSLFDESISAKLKAHARLARAEK
jgi:hypothetical protein